MPRHSRDFGRNYPLMANHRYKLDPPAKLVARDGTVVGVLTSVSLDLYVATAPPGEGGEVVGRQEELLPREGGVGETETERFDAPAEVWRHYCSVMKPRHQGLEPAMRSIIREALKVATITEVKRAIDGCAASEFHMGKNDGRKKYNKLPQIIKARRGHNETTRGRIDFFLELAEKSGLPSGFTSADPAKVSQAKRDVIDAVDFPGDAHVQERGAKATAWLVEHGIEIGTNPETGRPTFRVAGEPE